MLQELTPSLILKTISLGLSLPLLFLLARSQWTNLRHARRAQQHGCKPALRWKTYDPIFGLDFLGQQFASLKAHKLLENMAARFTTLGRRTATFSLMRKNFIATIEPENIKTALATDFKSWGLSQQRKRHLGKFLGQGIFTTDGEAWKHSREILRPAFVRGRIGDIDTFERHVQRLIKQIPRQGDCVVDLQPLFFAFTMDVATEFLFGESSDTLARWGGQHEGVAATEGGGDAAVSAEEFVEAFTYSQTRLEGGGEEAGWIGFLKLLLWDRKLKRSFRTVHKYVEGIVEKGLAQHADYKPEKSNYVFLHEVISETSDKTKIHAELLNILLAGRDTTASVLSNVWFELSKRPAIWARLQREVATLTGSRPTFEQLKELKYLNAVIKESLRLYPVVPENNREALEDTTLPLGGGDDEKSPIFVPKGCCMHYSLWTMHRRKDLYGADAEEFKPERWLDEEGRKGLRVGWEYLPFHGGPRICIGQQFALTEACYITVRLMQEFAGIESRDPEPWIEKISMTVTGKNGAKVVLTPRSS